LPLFLRSRLSNRRPSTSQAAGAFSERIPEQEGRKTNMNSLRISRLACLFVGLLTLGFVPRAAADCDQLLKAPVSPHGSAVQGSAELCIDENLVHATMHTENLTQGDAYTIWFAYIDDPTKCGNYSGGKAGVCQDQDFFLPAESPAGVFGRMDGTIAGKSGRARFTGSFRDLRFSHGAVVLFIMFGHGPASATDNRNLARQLLTPQLPVLGPPGLGAPADGAAGHGVAVAAFNIP
jgi:hypothetical protein